eukprot:scaffold386713_cov42-Prasinocladus_malaysianus.AAC.1
MSDGPKVSCEFSYLLEDLVVVSGPRVPPDNQFAAPLAVHPGQDVLEHAAVYIDVPDGLARRPGLSRARCLLEPPVD